MPRPSTGRRPYSVRLRPETVEAQRQPGQDQDSDVLLGLIVDGINARRGIIPAGHHNPTTTLEVAP